VHASMFISSRTASNLQWMATTPAKVGRLSFDDDDRMPCYESHHD
jgi:hypothetical protein